MYYRFLRESSDLNEIWMKLCRLEANNGTYINFTTRQESNSIYFFTWKWNTIFYQIIYQRLMTRSSISIRCWSLDDSSIIDVDWLEFKILNLVKMWTVICSFEGSPKFHPFSFGLFFLRKYVSRKKFQTPVCSLRIVLWITGAWLRYFRVSLY